MSFQDLSISQCGHDFKSVREWAKKLSISHVTLLHHASRGAIPIFALPPRDAVFFSVHRGSVGKAAAPIPDELLPVSMPDPDVIGLVLTKEDCAQLAIGSPLNISLFEAAVRKINAEAELVWPFKRLSDNSSSDDWRIAAYVKPERDEQRQWNLHLPLSISISGANVYMSQTALEDFIKRLTSFTFISDLYSGQHMIEELPSYVSGKLRELVDANRLFWRGFPDITPEERERREVQIRKYLHEHFLPLCDKRTSRTSLVKFAEQVSNPFLAPGSPQLPSTSLTPGLLAMLTAAKLYWSPHFGDMPVREAHPSREAVGDFLRWMGLKHANNASSGATVIRPEDLRPPTPKPLNKLQLIRQALQRQR